MQVTINTTALCVRSCAGQAVPNCTQPWLQSTLPVYIEYPILAGKLPTKAEVEKMAKNDDRWALLGSFMGRVPQGTHMAMVII